MFLPAAFIYTIYVIAENIVDVGEDDERIVFDVQYIDPYACIYRYDLNTQRLIDTFVNAVYVFNDKLVLTYNYQHGTQTISLDEIESALSSDFDGATPTKARKSEEKP